jgi:hypothetical protein
MTPKHPTKTKTGKADLSPFALSGLGSAADGAGMTLRPTFTGVTL